MYSPADNADNAEECSKLHYHAEKDSLFEVNAVLWFVCVICEISGRYLGFLCVDRLSTLACYSPADYADHAERNAASCIIPQRKTDWDG